MSIPADEIMLALERPRGLSARNILVARVEAVQAVSNWRLITTRIAADVPPLIVEVTADALTELHSTPGTELFLIIKTGATTVYGEADDVTPR